MKKICCLFGMLLLLVFITDFAGAQGLFTPSLPSGLKVYPPDRYFQVIPRIVPADKESTIKIISRFEHFPKPFHSYKVTYTPVGKYVEKSGWVKPVAEDIIPENNTFVFTKFFEYEQEHTIKLEEITPDNKVKEIGVFHIYSLKPDLFSLRPYKGDFHMHSFRSDGRESPGYVAGACRRAGLDFMGLSDHRNYSASLEAIKLFEGLPIDLKIYPSEEVHPPDNPVHFISFGAREGITELYKDDETKYREEVKAIMESVGELPYGVDRFHYASCIWTFEKIRERGGLGVFAHPYWRPSNTNYIPYALVDYLFETKIFDAVELISGFGWDELQQVDVNNLQLSKYIEMKAKGYKVPVVGISDSHGCEIHDMFGRYYTICFSKSLELNELINAIKEEMSVAVETPAGQLPRAFGVHRLVMYSHFLLRYVFPIHDEMCFEEGRLMIEYAGGNKDVVKQLGLLKGQVERFYSQVWAKE
ncbi:MAG: hypothetical protein N3G21_01515 [Candidatus Hydrogenedentes bacterium]|nr:hypothetical protein [Candidatus Hydrogenedentota bacterium]